MTLEGLLVIYRSSRVGTVLPEKWVALVVLRISKECCWMMLIKVDVRALFLMISSLQSPVIMIPLYCRVYLDSKSSKTYSSSTQRQIEFYFWDQKFWWKETLYRFYSGLCFQMLLQLFSENNPLWIHKLLRPSVSLYHFDASWSSVVWNLSEVGTISTRFPLQPKYECRCPLWYCVCDPSYSQYFRPLYDKH